MEATTSHCLSDIDRVIEGLSRLRHEAVQRFAETHDATDQDIRVMGIARSIRVKIASLVKEGAVPGDEFLIDEALWRMRLYHHRTSLFTLDLAIVRQACIMLIMQGADVESVRQWLNLEATRSTPSHRKLSRNAVYRFIQRLRRELEAARFRFAGITPYEFNARPAQSDGQAPRLRPLPEHHLEPETIELVKKAARMLSLKGIQINLHPAELIAACRLIAAIHPAFRVARAWLEQQTGQRVHQATYHSLEDRFVRAFNRLGGETAGQRSKREMEAARRLRSDAQTNVEAGSTTVQ